MPDPFAQFAVGKQGNVDLYKQPKVKNPDGTTSTVDSSSYNIDGVEVLLPSVTPDGRHLRTRDEIIGEYRKTGRYLGKFKTPEEATAYASQLHNDYAAGKYDRQPDDPFGAYAAKPAPAKSGGPDWGEASTFGGMVGGLGGFFLGGPPGALAGAALGGAIGEGANAYFGKEPAASLGDGLVRASVGGAKQGLLEAIPQGIGRIFTRTAPHVMDMGLKRTAADRLKFPNTPQRLVNEGIVPRGQNVQNALSATEGRINTQAAAFDAANPIGRVDPDTLATEAQSFAHKSGKVGGLGNVPGPEAAELDALKQNYLAQNTRTRGLAETIDQKRAYQARSSYSSRPNSPTQTNNELNFNEGIAGANRASAIKLNPALEGDLAKERDLIGALEAQKNAEAKVAPLSTVGQIRTGLMLRNPTAMGGAAIGLDRAGRGAKSPMTPAAIRAAYLALLGSE